MRGNARDRLVGIVGAVLVSALLWGCLYVATHWLATRA